VGESPGPLTSQIHDEILHGIFCILRNTGRGRVRAVCMYFEFLGPVESTLSAVFLHDE